MKLKIAITLKSIIRLEQLLKKPFGSVDFSDTEQMIPFLYCCAICNNDTSLTLAQFEELCTSPQIWSKFYKAFKKESEQLAQFQQYVEGQGTDEAPTYLKDIIPSLILSGGLHPNYVLNQLELCDVPMFFEAMNQRDRSRMESDRLWTYLTMLPHIDGKKLKSP